MENKDLFSTTISNHFPTEVFIKMMGNLWFRVEEFVEKQLPYAFFVKDGKAVLSREEWGELGSVMYDILMDAVRGGFIEGHKQGGLGALSILGKDEYDFDADVDKAAAKLLFDKIVDDIELEKNE